jgi:hypothetical protein
VIRLGRILIKGVWRRCEILSWEGTGIGSEAIAKVISGKLKGQTFETDHPEDILQEDA